LLPIGIYSLAFSPKAGIAAAILCSVIWFVVEVLTSEHTNLLIHFWNAAIRLGFFLLPTILFKVVEQERRLARADALTGAFNNRYFIELLQREIDRSVRYRHFFTVAFIDTDNFKIINDTFGHAFGDSALQAIVKLMKKHLRKTDLVARVGGDEFAILLPETDSAAARSAITNMTGKLCDELIRMKYPITFSIGVLTLSAPHLSAEEVLRIADKMMYIVKNNGKNNVRYEVYSEEKKAVG
jgi:diguanylate cyclase (GGDEF)-like protein